MQVMIWLSHLAELSMINLDCVEILSDFCRCLLERVGNRPGIYEFALTWLAGTRMAIMRLNDIPLIEMILTPGSLYVRSNKMRPLGAYWYFGSPPPQLQSSRAFQFLQDLKSRQIENRNLMKSLNGLLLVTSDIQFLSRLIPAQAPNLEVPA